MGAYWIAESTYCARSCAAVRGPTGNVLEQVLHERIAPALGTG